MALPAVEVDLRRVASESAGGVPSVPEFTADSAAYSHFRRP